MLRTNFKVVFVPKHRLKSGKILGYARFPSGTMEVVRSPRQLTADGGSAEVERVCADLPKDTTGEPTFGC